MTGYVVHYSSNGVTNSLSDLSSSATSYEITGLTIGRIYSISVEALVSATAVRVEWSQPSGGATVTGYVVHYSSNGVTNSLSGLSSSATSYQITGLTNGRTYTNRIYTIHTSLMAVSTPSQWRLPPNTCLESLNL